MANPDTADDQLPGYTTSSGAARTAPTHCSHSYSLENKGHAWLTLKITNSRALNAKHLPVFHDADTVKGSVEVDLDKAESAKAVTIAVRAFAVCDRAEAAHGGCAGADRGGNDIRRAGRVSVLGRRARAVERRVGRQAEG
jgi:hypothetical protein